MVRLSAFKELSASDASSDIPERLGWYWWFFDLFVIFLWVVVVFFAFHVGQAGGAVRTRKRSARLKWIRRRVLPRHPDSLICANCLSVVKR
jgi:hypothetical protein